VVECFLALCACGLFVVFGAVDPEAALYKELWHACAGPLVTVPRLDELVYYFPQGHIEQVCFYFLIFLLQVTLKILSNSF